MKTITFGDLHGRTIWEEFADIKILIETPHLETEYDKYIFVGDYTDSFEETNVTILHNLKRLIQFKSNYPDKVVLLLGNHDLQYMHSFDQYGCSGFRPEAFFDLNDLFRENEMMFQVAYQYGSTVWTHAGIHRGWYQYEFPFESVNIAEDLNGAYQQHVKSLFDCGHTRGGYKNQGGPFWADKSETSTKPLKGISQVVGHTPQKDVVTVQVSKDKDHTLYYVDCLMHNKALQMEFTEHLVATQTIEVEPQTKYPSIEDIYE